MDTPIIYALDGYGKTETCSGSVTMTKSQSVKSYMDSRSGVQNPHWRDQIKNGSNATTPYQRSGTRIIEWTPYKVKRVLTKPCSLVGGNTQKLREWGGSHVTPPSLIVSMSDTEAMNKAIMQFIDDHNKQSTSLLGGVMLKEWRETIALIKNPAKALWDEAHRYHRDAKKRIRRTKPSSRNAVLSNLWLEYSFGWIPLISDIQAAAQAAAKVIEKDYGVYVIRGYGRTDNVSKETFRSWAPPGALTCGIVREFTQMSNMVVLKGGLKPAASGPTESAHLISQLGFTPNSFVPSVWECIPYSFLSDYFVNIGDLLGATFHSWSDLTWSSMARVGNTHFRSTILAQTPKETDYNWTVSPGKLLVTSQTFARTVPTNLVPSLAFEVPGSVPKWLNIAALAKIKSVA